MVENMLDIPIQQAEDLLRKFYDIDGHLTRLVGYDDINFLVQQDSGEMYILKISRPDFETDYLDFQEKLLEHLNFQDERMSVPTIIKTLKGINSVEFFDDSGNCRNIRLLSWIEGRLWNEVNPKLDNLRFDLGKSCGLMAKSLINFDHPHAEREHEWDVAQSLWTKNFLHLFDSEQQKIITYFQNEFESNLLSFSKLRKSIIHGDANDNNIIVSDDLLNPKVESIIDFGDAIYTQTINELAICCAYAIMDYNDPLDASLPVIKGFNSSFSLEEIELEHLYNAIAMRLVISVTKSAIAKETEPNNEYLQISERPAWNLLNKWFELSPDLAHYAFRYACGFSPHPNEEKFIKWAKIQSFKISELIPSATSEEVLPLDLSIGSTWVGHEKEIGDLELFQFKIDRLQKQNPQKIIAGGYCEPRGIYTSEAYDKIGNSGRESRTIHIGIDFWFPAYTPIHAVYDGQVVTAFNDSGNKEYGGLVILKHTAEDFEFFTLYAHNTPESATQHKVGDKIKRGQKITELGNYPENGNWAPHLHFQVMLSMLDYKLDFPGVAYHSQIEIWKSIVPDANLLFKNEGLVQLPETNNDSLIKKRKEILGRSLSLQYNNPIKMVRGSGIYLIDQFGRKYLDTINNVAHVGHENYDVVKAGQKQMAVLNTNSRYLHNNILEAAKELLETFPEELSVVHFVNSGSEANELALRMVKAVTGSSEIIASEVGYHGNTSTTIDISSYKFEGKGGTGAPPTTHIFPLPDTFRGKYRGENAAEDYTDEVKSLIDKILGKGKKLGALILEPILSCGGQIELPKGFLKKVYQLVRDAGGLSISDEVQTGCGRMGSTFWGFQLHDVIPDIVTIGKPLGNGHPVAAVVCTREVADAFANGMEYFNTFGGNPVSCAIATEVLRIVKREKLQDNALNVGEYLKDELKKLSKEFPIIGDIRGQGLFLGMELVDDDLNPLPLKIQYLINRMKDFGILMSSDGRDENVIKIKPPMIFSKENADELLFYLSKVFNEDYMKLNYK